MTKLSEVLKPRYARALYDSGFVTVEDLQEAIKRYGLGKFGKSTWWWSGGASSDGPVIRRGFGEKGWLSVFEYFEKIGFDYKQYVLPGSFAPEPKTKEQYEIIINQKN